MNKSIQKFGKIKVDIVKMDRANRDISVGLFRFLKKLGKDQ